MTTRNTPDQDTIDFMMSEYKSAEPYDFDDPIVHLVDSEDEIHDKRMNATVAKRWLIDVGILQE